MLLLLRLPITLRRSFLYQPLAALLAILLLAPLSWLTGNYGRGSAALQLAAQTPSQPFTVTCATPNRIIQKCGGNLYTADIVQFENDAVQQYLAVHSLPPASAQLIYSYGQTDLRSEIRALLVSNMMSMINKPAASRTTHEANLIAWFQALMHNNEYAEYAGALAENTRFNNNPCTFTLDPIIASAYSLSYSGAAECYNQTNETTVLFGTTNVPNANYYLAVGLQNSYNSAVLSADPALGQVVLVQTLELSQAALGYAAIPAVAAAAGTAAAYTGGILAPFAVRPFFVSNFGTAVEDLPEVADAAGTAAEAGAETGTSVAVEAAGPLAIVAIAALIAIEEVIKVVADEQSQMQIAWQNSYVNTLACNPQLPDLGSFVNDSSGVAQSKIFDTLVAATLPEVVPNPSVLQTLPYPLEPFVTKTNQAVYINYVDWRGRSMVASTASGMFLTCNGAHATCTQDGDTTWEFLIPTIDFTDSLGVNRSASRSGVNFIITKQTPGPSDINCIQDPTQGTNTQQTTANCSSYVTTSFNYLDSTQKVQTMQLLPPPTLTFGPVASFTVGQAASFPVTASGFNPSLFAEVYTLPAGFSFASVSALGTSVSSALVYTPQYTSPGVLAPVIEGTYATTIGAVDGIGDAYNEINQPLSVVLRSTNNFTSSPTLTVTTGVPVNFAVTTTGQVSPISLQNYTLPVGLTFTDNGNGSGAITGTATQLSQPTCSASFCGFLTSQGATQPFSITVQPQPSPLFTYTGPITFAVNEQNEVDVAVTALTAPQILVATGSFTPLPTFTGPITPVPLSVNLVAGAPWLNVTVTTGGYIKISGTPPVGAATGPFVLYALALASYSVPTLQTFVINTIQSEVVNSTNPPAAAVGTNFNVFVPDNTGTNNLTLVGGLAVLPTGLSGANISGGFTISGIPGAGSGGVYPITVSSAPVSSGTTCNTANATVANTAAAFQAPAAAAPGVASTAASSQIVNLEVDETASIISQPKVRFFTGVPDSFNIQTLGFPRQTITSRAAGTPLRVKLTGALPNGITYTDLNPAGAPIGNGLFSGTASAGSTGAYPLTLTASNGIGSPYQQAFTLTIGLPGDADGNGIVNCADIALVKAAFGSGIGGAGYNFEADLNHDGVVNALDLNLVVANLPAGSNCNTSVPGFSITANPPNETIRRGHLAAFLLQLQELNGFTGDVTLSCSGGPTGSYCADLPQKVHFFQGKALALSGVFFPPSTAPGKYTLTINGVSGALTNSATAQFTVQN